jgi:threonine dehydrogenase-like Zn-dependent dehydrogenase
MQTIPLAEGGYILLLKNFLNPTQSATCFNTLLAETTWLQKPAPFGHTQPRLTAAQGDPRINYRYSGTTNPASPWTQTLLQLKDRIQSVPGSQTLLQAMDAVRSGGKIIGVAWYGGPLELDIDIFRERSLRYLFPDISTQAHLEHTVRLVATGRVSLKGTITHVLHGLESVDQAFEITANKGKYNAINPAQVMMRQPPAV